MQGSIKNWQEDDRPREKLRTRGAQALTDAELLAILLGTGTAKLSALDLARNILNIANFQLHQLSKLSLKELQQVKGIGEAKAISITAAMELGNRIQRAELSNQPIFNTPEATAQYLITFFRAIHHEQFVVLYLNNRLQLIKESVLSSGGMTGTVVDVRLLFKQGLLENAAKIIVAHNHPSGNLTPSREDQQLTEKIKATGELMNIQLLDHFIISGNEYVSFSEQGIL